MLETAFTEAAGLHDYLGTPEIVEDIAICCKQRLGIDLPTRFRNRRFLHRQVRTDDVRRCLLETALVFVHPIETRAEVGFGCNNGYATDGKLIPSEDILSIKLIEA